MDAQEQIRDAIRVLEEGGLILYPTDTIWGIGCDPQNEEAIGRLLRLKAYDGPRPLVVLVSDEAQLNRYVKEVPEVAWDLIEEAPDASLTIIYPEGYQVAEQIKGEDGSLAIRVVKQGFCGQLLKKYGKPLVSTSGNVKGQNPPADFGDISDRIRTGVDAVIPAHFADEHMTKKASPVIKLGEKGEVEVVRK